MISDNEIAIYEWRAWSSFLFPTLFPDSTRIQAKLEDWDSDVLSQLPPTTKFFVFHLNMTHTSVVPHHRRALCCYLEKNGILAVNADATNISKAFVQLTCQRLGLQTTLATREGEPEEKVIIKTNRNYGGLGESEIAIPIRRLLGLESFANSMDAKSYRITRRRDIEPEIWLRTDLVVERFIENSRDLFYRAYWLCSQLVVSEVVDPLPIKKMPEGIERRNWFFRLSCDAPTPAEETPRSIQMLATEIALLIHSTRLDFGTLDIVVNDSSEFFFVDINTTPSWRDTHDPQIVPFLRAGLSAMSEGTSKDLLNVS